MIPTELDVSKNRSNLVDRSISWEIRFVGEYLEPGGLPPNLPRVSGTTVVFERLLTQLVRQRIAEAKSDEPLTILARSFGGEEPRGVLVSLVDIPDSSRRNATGHPPEVVQQGMASMGGEVICVEDSSAGRVTLMRLAVANA